MTKTTSATVVVRYWIEFSIQMSSINKVTSLDAWFSDDCTFKYQKGYKYQNMRLVIYEPLRNIMDNSELNKNFPSVNLVLNHF